MDESAKYVIHAVFTADGVVERSDVVGAVFGQTEGLLGEELDLRDLQQTSKVGRIDVEVTSREGAASGELTIASNLDRTETAILAAALETIDRVGPCTAEFRIDRIEDVRTAKRRQVIARAKELLAEAFDEGPMNSEELIEEVRESARADTITEYEGLPAGPRVPDSDAIIVVEGRADVLTLLKYGIKNAVAVEGTDVPDAIADLTRQRTVTAFLDGDRGGDLILRELGQVGDIDYVAFAPKNRSVEDLERHEVLTALREKVPFDVAMAEHADDSVEENATDTPAATDGSAQPAPEMAAEPIEPSSPVDPPDRAEAVDAESASEPHTARVEAPSLPDHVAAVIGERAGTVRLLDGEFEPLDEAPAADAFDVLAAAEPAPDSVVLDGELTQRVLDIAAQRGVARIVARETGEFVKRPTGVRVLTADAFEGA